MNSDQIQQYREGGYLLREGLFSAEEMRTLRKECHDLSQRLSAAGQGDATWGSARTATMAETALLHCHNVQFFSAPLGRLLLDPRIGQTASELMGSPNVQLHHNKMFIKPPERGSPFPMHQDAPFFPHERHTMMAAIIHFDDAPLEKGCLRVVPESHKRGILDHLSEGGWHLDPANYPIEDATPVPAKAGDVLFFTYLTIHGSGINESSEARTTLLIQMRDPLDKPTEETHLSRGQGTMLWGIDPDPDPSKAFSA